MTVAGTLNPLGVAIKIIISRKGFDSKYGSCSNPIIDGQPIAPSFLLIKTSQKVFLDHFNLATYIYTP